METEQERKQGSQEAWHQLPRDSLHFLPCSPQFAPRPTSVFFLGSAVFRDTLGS